MSFPRQPALTNKQSATLYTINNQSLALLINIPQTFKNTTYGFLHLKSRMWYLHNPNTVLLLDYRKMY